MRLADFIESNTPAIIQAWESFARTRLPAASGMDAEALRDHAVQMLQTVCADLRTPQSDSEQHVKSLGPPQGKWRAPSTAAEVHALLRAAGGFTPQQLVAEYRALRASVLHLYGEAHEPDRQTLKDVGRFNESLDQLIAESVDFYSLEVERWRNIFLGVLSHDLRGPLNAILLTSQVLARVGSEAKVSEATARLIRSGERMKQLLDDLLDYNRTSMDIGIPVRPESADLAAVCREELELRRAAHPESTITLEAPEAEPGSWDESRMKQALGNLVSNAAKYGTPGEPIVVRLESADDEVVLSVESRGTDLSPATLATLFEPYRRGAQVQPGEDTTSLGLGLFIVREITRAHGGTVRVASTGGRTRFSLAFPKFAPSAG